MYSGLSFVESSSYCVVFTSSLFLFCLICFPILCFRDRLVFFGKCCVVKMKWASNNVCSSRSNIRACKRRACGGYSSNVVGSGNKHRFSELSFPSLSGSSVFVRLINSFTKQVAMRLEGLSRSSP